MTVAEVTAIAQAFHDAVANQDAAAMASLYAEDARFLPPNFEPCEGRPAIQARIEQLFQAGVRSLDIDPKETREAGDLTVEYGSYALGVEPEGGEPIVDVGKYVVVHESQGDGSTKIIFDIFNSNAPAA